MYKHKDPFPEKWQKVASKTVFEHPRLTLVEDDVALPDGKTIKYLRHENKDSGGVIVICIKDGRILLQQEYSYPVDEVLYQFPGGRIEETETHIEAAKRECIEESGLIPEELEYIGWFYPDNRRTKAKLHVVLARNFTKTKKQGGDDEERIANSFMSVTELRQKIREGAITNYALLAAWALLTAKYSMP